MDKYVYGISARIKCLGGDVVVRSKPETKILLGRRLKIGWRLIMLGMKIAAEEYDYMIEEKPQKHVCKNCKWRSDDFTSVCVNDASDHLADFVMPDDRCPEWEARMNYTERVEGYQIRDVTYLGMPPKDAPIEYDIVKWAKPDKPYEALSLDTMKNEITKKLITEYCYSVGRLVWDRRESGFEFKSIGLRWLEAKPSEAVVDMVLKFAEEKAKELEAEDD